MGTITKEKIRADEFQVVQETLSVPFLPNAYFNESRVGNYLIVKRGFDIAIASVLTLALLSWLYPILSVLIMLSSKGGALFVQKRVGKNGKVFNCYKFRTMYVNADADVVEAQLNDKRITAIGKWMRNTYIDELPQLVNVLTGDMSIVGPRPHMITQHFRFCSDIPKYDYRHAVKPGLTGLSQVKGYHGPMAEAHRLQGRTKLDLFYLQKMSMSLDMMILVRTFFIVFPFNLKK